MSRARRPELHLLVWGRRALQPQSIVPAKQKQSLPQTQAQCLDAAAAANKDLCSGADLNGRIGELLGVFKIFGGFPGLMAAC